MKYIYRKYDWLNRKQPSGLMNFWRDGEYLSDLGRYKLEIKDGKYYVSDTDPQSRTINIEQTKEEILRDFETVDGERLDIYE
jgi:hypothetical protein